MIHAMRDVHKDMKYMILGAEDILTDFVGKKYGEAQEEDYETYEDENWEVNAFKEVYAQL